MDQTTVTQLMRLECDTNSGLGQIHHTGMRNSFHLLLLLGCALWPAAAFAQTKTESPSSPLAKCLPAGIKLTDIVEVIRAHGEGQETKPARNVTVAEKLQELQATCNDTNQLLAAGGKPIAFYHLAGCWGNPPPDYQEILQKQRAEIAKLEQQHTVIKMTCNPSGARIP